VFNIAACTIALNDKFPDRYVQLRATVESQLPDAVRIEDMVGSVHRASLCWLARVETLLDSADSATNESILQRFVLFVIYAHFTVPKVGSELFGPYEAISRFGDSNWMTALHECEWDFIDCNEKMQVERLKLSNLDLQGTIPTELSLLSNLVSLDLGDNSFTGLIPSELWNLKQMERLVLSQNQLSGTISEDVTNLRDLHVFSVARNANLVGTFPDLFGLKELLELNVESTFIEGPFPDLSSSTKLGKTLVVALRY
jgi:hypothetical protein